MDNVDDTEGSRLRDLAVPTASLPASITCAKVERIFGQSPNLDAVLVAGVDGGVVVVGRRRFFERLIGPLGFGRALHGRRPVRTLFGPVTRSFPGGLPVEEAAMQLLSSADRDGDEEVLVELDGGWGLVAEGRLHAHLARRYQEQADRIRWNERRLRALLENSADVVLVLDPDGTVRYRSRELASVGHRVVETMFELVHPDDAEGFAAALRRVQEEPGVAVDGECRVRSSQGGVRRFEYRCQNMSHDPAVGGIVVNARDVTGRRLLEDQLRRQALHDSLTGLPNREHLSRRLQYVVSRRDRRPGDIAVLFCDLDGFKAVNDEHGHAFGDALLAAMGQRLSLIVRRADLLARLGGDEFVVLVDGASPQHAVDLAHRMLHALRTPIVVNGTRVQLTGSIGVTVGAEPTTADLLLQEADAAMYAAKTAGRNRVVLYDAATHEHTLRSARLAHELRGAIDRQELHLVYQPIVELASGSVSAYEALLRWTHPQLGSIPPAEFIVAAESHGLMSRIGTWVLDQACEQLRRWEVDGDDEVVISVNVSPFQLDDDALIDAVERNLRLGAVPPRRLQLEITESAVVTTGARAARLQALHRLGLSLAIDDFGTGYSSLSSFAHLPFDVVKLDQSFLRAGGGLDVQGELIRGVIELGNRLGYRTVAEGIEEREQLDALRAIGCHAGQGYLLGHPAPAPERTNVTGIVRQARMHELTATIGSGG